VIVGDYDPQKLELLIKEFFGVIPKRDNPLPSKAILFQIILSPER
jgi:predicted Zn-dependent peptidase